MSVRAGVSMMRLSVLAMVAVASVASAADVTMVHQTVSQGKQRQVTLSVRGDWARVELQEEGKPTPVVMLRDLKNNSTYVVDHSRKTVLEMTEADQQAVEAQQKQFFEQMRAQLDKLPPEQRKRIEATMLATPTGAASAPPLPNYTYEKKKSGARKVNGFTCSDYAMTKDGEPAGEGCFMSWKDASMSAEEFKDFMVRVVPRNGALASSGLLESVNHAPGFPVTRTTLDEKGAPKTEMTLKSLSRKALPADQFELPADYARRTLTKQ